MYMSLAEVAGGRNPLQRHHWLIIARVLSAALGGRAAATTAMTVSQLTPPSKLSLKLAGVHRRHRVLAGMWPHSVVQSMIGFKLLLWHHRLGCARLLLPEALNLHLVSDHSQLSSDRGTCRSLSGVQ
jgi:hypothetical protein